MSAFAAGPSVDPDVLNGYIAAALERDERQRLLDGQQEPAEPDPPDPDLEPRFTFLGAGGFILDTPPDPVPVWGIGRDVLWAEGESIIIAASQGLGKTTLGQQLTLGRAGLPEYAQLLGFPIMPGVRRVLYLAMDRPRQAARSFRRMVGEAHRAELDARVAVWPGPPPSDMAKHPGLLLTLCQHAGADTVVLDSLKDAALGLGDDEVGAAYNRARQLAIADGVEVVELHHLRKAANGGRKGAPSLDDIYGSTWITSGAGSILHLDGQAGDPVVTMRHLKQSMNQLGPWQVAHDGETGRSRIFHAADLAALAVATLTGLSAIEAACALFDTDKPSSAERERARRRLEQLERDGRLVVIDEGSQRTGSPRRWGAP